MLPFFAITTASHDASRIARSDQDDALIRNEELRAMALNNHGYIFDPTGADASRARMAWSNAPTKQDVWQYRSLLPSLHRWYVYTILGRCARTYRDGLQL